MYLDLIDCALPLFSANLVTTGKDRSCQGKSKYEGTHQNNNQFLHLSRFASFL